VVNTAEADLVDADVIDENELVAEE
jgi:hypothetical protein